MLRSPIEQVIVTDANAHHGSTWNIDGLPGGILDIGLVWRGWGTSGSEYGCDVQQVNDFTYILGFEDLGYWPLYVDLIVQVVVIPSLLDHFALTVSPDSVRHPESAGIKIQGKDRDNNDVEPTADTKVHVTIPSDDIYGNLVYLGKKGKAITDVPYADAKAGKVTFVADGEDPVNIGPQWVTIGVTKAGNESIAGSAKVKVKPSVDKYCQNDSKWDTVYYDHYKKLTEDGDVVQPEQEWTIGDKGCTLSCMAMILNAVGLDYDPMKLNQKMTTDSLFARNGKGNWTGGVYWRAVTKYGSSKIKSDIQSFGDNDNNWDNKIPLDIKQIDACLQKNSFVIAMVGNPSRNDPNKVSGHWVLVTGMKNGSYEILDPGCFVNTRITLDSYSNKIYRAIAYERNSQ